MKRFAMLLVISVPLLFLAVGCVSTKTFDQAIADVTKRVDDVQTRVEQQGEKIDQLEKKSGELDQKVQVVDSKATKAEQTGSTALAKAAEAEKLAKGKVIWKVTLTNRDVHFGVDKTELTPEGAKVLDQFVEKLKSFDRMVFIEIQGHTDSTGSAAYNKKLGLKRAEAVRDYLHERGIPLNLMQVISYGEERPIADNSTREGRAQNRRVEILVLE